MRKLKYSIEVIPELKSQELKVINDYWKLEDYKFVNKPSQIEKDNNIYRSDLLRLIYDCSYLKLLIDCSVCGLVIDNFAKSQSEFKTKLKTFPGIKCEDCLQDEEDRKTKNDFERRVIIERHMKLAIEEKRWNLLNKREIKILKTLITFSDFKEFLKSEQHKHENKSFWKVIFKLENLCLVYLVKPNNGYVTDYVVLPELASKIKSIELEEASVKLDKLSFRLLKNNNRNQYDDTQFSGVITFKKEIVLKPNEKYTYGVWSRSNGDLHISLVLVSELEVKPKQERIESQPKQIKDSIRSFFRDFEN